KPMGITEAECLVTDPPDILKIDYVPPPVPPRLPFDVCAYYFPGWNSPAKWYCIRDYAPERRPALGYYDEGNPECVDWHQVVAGSWHYLLPGRLVLGPGTAVPDALV
ncbi:MAG TPA: hypothetical protein PKX28_07970, partial [Candidatus Hydrogenedentes bacterium]|nr:hypothetical protein [Candidatus Hydrogenedentota bacterium]